MSFDKSLLYSAQFLVSLEFSVPGISSNWANIDKFTVFSGVQFCRMVGVF